MYHKSNLARADDSAPSTVKLSRTQTIRRSSPEAVEYVPATHKEQLDELDEPACRVRTQCSTSSNHTPSHSQRYQNQFPTLKSYNLLPAVSVPAPSTHYPPLLLCRLENGAAKTKCTHIQAQPYANTRRSSPEAVEYVPATHIVQLDELDEPACSVRTQCSTSSKHPSPHHHSHRFPTRQVLEASH